MASFLASLLMGFLFFLLFLSILIIILGVLFYIFIWRNVLKNKILLSCPDTSEMYQYQFQLPLPIDPRQYSPQVARALLELSIAVTDVNCPNFILPLPTGFDKMEFLYGKNPVTGVSTYYGTFFYSTSSKTCLLVFSGTATYTDWVEDISYFQVYPSKINNMNKIGTNPLVHRGFYNIYVSIQEKIHSLISTHDTRQIIVTGHSLGGALATLCAIDLYRADQPDEDMFLVNETFAAPRVGNIDFANILDNYLKFQYRVYNTEDLITQLPPAVLPASLYKQTGQGIGFTLNMGSLDANHVLAYEKYLY